MRLPIELRTDGAAGCNSTLLGRIWDERRRRAASIRAGFARLASDDRALGYLGPEVSRARNELLVKRCAEPETLSSVALLHHGQYLLDRAGREYDSHGEGHSAMLIAAAGDAVAASGPELGCSGSITMVDADRCLHVEDERYASTVYSITPEAIDGDVNVPNELLAEAMHLVNNAGFGWLVSEGAGVVVLRYQLADRKEQGAFSYSLGALPATIVTDWPYDPVVIAESLIHESSHVLLNDALSVAEISWPVDRRFYSPWKETMRPAFGFVHACYAFGNLASFFEACTARADLGGADLGGDSRRYCEIRSDVERRRMAMARPDMEELLSELGDADVVDLLASSRSQPPIQDEVAQKVAASEGRPTTP